MNDDGQCKPYFVAESAGLDTSTDNDCMRPFFWQFHLVLLYVSFMTWVILHTESSIESQGRQDGIVHAVASGACAWISAFFSFALLFLRNVILVPDDVTVVRLNRSARRRTRKFEPSPFPPLSPVLETCCRDLDLGSIIFRYSRGLVRKIWCNCTKQTCTSVMLAADGRVCDNRPARRQMMLKHWRQAHRQDPTISWLLWKQVTAAFFPRELSASPPALNNRYTSIFQPAVPSAAPLFLYNQCILLIRHFLFSSSLTHVDPDAVGLHEFRQCEWQDNGVRCTQRTRDLNTVFCTVHGAGICVDYELALNGTVAHRPPEILMSVPKLPPRKRSKKGKERETEDSDVIIQAVSPSDSPQFRIIYATLDDAQKTQTFQHLLATTLEDKTKATASAVFTVAAEHQMKRCKRDLLIPLMRNHACQWNCLVRAADAAAAGVIMFSAQQPDQFGRAPLTPLPPRSRPLRPLTDGQKASDRARRRADSAALVAEKDSANIEWWRTNWPQEESSEALKEASPLPFFML
ncbi:hypothetical protein GGX14DRAFT_643536 [Mycena pura]|uniref:Uncharacterized protein n=1 Tax=Mycena pura TaxID=153505 RepID=A0AAD6VGF3_9AGAR|nr:hypothetical protein GGX14DRAFT_643536 [Mycena pura]